MHRNGHNKYQVSLSDAEKTILTAITKKGNHSARVIKRAHILLAADTGKEDTAICEHYAVHRSTVHDIRQHYVQAGIHRALYDLPRPGQPRKITGVQEAAITAIACTKAPKGYVHWTLDLLTEKIHSKGISIGRTAIWNILLRNDLKPWRKKNVVHTHHYA